MKTSTSKDIKAKKTDYRKSDYFDLIFGFVIGITLCINAALFAYCLSVIDTLEQVIHRLLLR